MEIYIPEKQIHFGIMGGIRVFPLTTDMRLNLNLGKVVGSIEKGKDGKYLFVQQMKNLPRLEKLTDKNGKIIKIGPIK